MQSFVKVTGIVASLPMANVDTDVIMPKQFLKGIDRSGLDKGALYDLRFDAEGRERTDFVLNQPAWRHAKFLIVGPNFGCGSSREHAVWGLMQYGIRAILGTSFAGIFADNSANNGLLLISLKPEDIDALTRRADNPADNTICVDLEEQLIVAGPMGIRFQTDPLRRDALMRGLDAIGSTLDGAEEIRSFQTRHLAEQPWLA
jgi:3-isopropylmalate/(R)-2-methylmalate dehydratase small subunit